MPQMHAAILILLALLTSRADPRVDFPSDLERWYFTEPPGKYSGQWLTANNDIKHEWSVTPGDAGPRVALLGPENDGPRLPFKFEEGTYQEGLAGRRTIKKVEDGWIVGFDGGEFGAGLWWFSPDGARRHKISDDHVIGFIPTESGLLAVEGIAHGGTSEGQIARLFQDRNGRWQSETFVDLGHAPEVAVKDVDGSLIVATTNRLLRIVPASKKVEVMLNNMFWDGLYMNSMVLTPPHTIFIGMRHGVARIRKEGKSYKVAWLLPSKEFAEREDDEGPK